MDEKTRQYLEERIEFYKKEKKKAKNFFDILLKSEIFAQAETTLTQMKIALYTQFIEDLERILDEKK